MDLRLPVIKHLATVLVIFLSNYQPPRNCVVNNNIIPLDDPLEGTESSFLYNLHS